VPSRQKLAQYKQIDIKTRVDSASPHRLIQMLFDGALEALAQGKGAMVREEIEAKGKALTKAATIISGLRDSLNKDVDSELPYNLDHLYEYMQRRTMDAHAQNDPQAIEEVVELLQNLKSGWDEISPE